jgi:hypothetical protein
MVFKSKVRVDLTEKGAKPLRDMGRSQVAISGRKILGETARTKILS